MVLVYVLLTAVVGLIFANYLRWKIISEPTGDEKMQEISRAIHFIFYQIKAPLNCMLVNKCRNMINLCL